jgi:hypothetical protein
MHFIDKIEEKKYSGPKCLCAGWTRCDYIQTTYKWGIVHEGVYYILSSSKGIFV